MIFLNAFKKRVLMIGGEGVVLFGPTARGIEREAAISWEAPDFDRQLVEALTEQNRDAPVLLLFDAADQTYRKEENIPRLSPMDRAKYIQRKLDQAFPSYPVRSSMLIKPGKPNPPFYLFVALPETDRLDRIADDLLEAGVPVAGFGLLPLESVGLVEALTAKAFSRVPGTQRWSVVISQQETGGLRQVVSRNGQLALTRITPVTESGVSGPGWAEDVIREFKATLTYIARFGYIPQDELDVVVVCGALEKEFFSDKSLPVTNFRCLTTPEALTLIGARGVALGENNFGDALHAAWGARQRSLRLAIPVPSLRRIMLPRTAVWYGSVALSLLALVLCGYVFYEYSSYADIRDDAETQELQQQRLEQEYAQDSSAFDGLPVKPEVVRNTLKIKQVVDNGVINIAPTLYALRKSLDSDMKLRELKFRHEPDASLAASASAAPPPAPAPGAAPDKNKSRGEVTLTFSFTLPDSLDLETKIRRADALTDTLRAAFPSSDVRILTPFGNVTGTGTYAGEVGKRDTASRSDEFTEFEIKGPPL